MSLHPAKHDFICAAQSSIIQIYPFNQICLIRHESGLSTAHPTDMQLPGPRQPYAGKYLAAAVNCFSRLHVVKNSAAPRLHQTAHFCLHGIWEVTGRCCSFGIVLVHICYGSSLCASCPILMSHGGSTSLACMARGMFRYAVLLRVTHQTAHFHDIYTCHAHLPSKKFSVETGPVCALLLLTLC